MIMSNRGLLISGAQSRLSILEAALKQSGWKVDSFLKPIDALKRIKARDYVAVFCDEQLKGASAAGLLVGTKRLNSNLDFYLFSESMDPSRFSSSGAPTAFLPFPPIQAKIPKPEGGSSQPEPTSVANLQGNTSLVSIVDIINMMGYTKQNAIIEFDAGKTGQVFLNNGKIQHALYFSESQSLSGLAAFGELLALKDSDFRIREYEKPKRLTINMPNSTAMTEASRRIDESQRYKNFVKKVVELCPEVTDISVGYLLSPKPYTGYGGSEELFELAKVLIKTNRDAMKIRVDNIFLTTESHTYSLKSFKEDTIIVARAPASLNDELGLAVRKAYSEVFSKG